MKDMQVIMPAFHGRSSTLVSCDVCTQIDSVVCCSLVQAANAETLGPGDVLVMLCVTHADVCGARPNLSPHIPQVFTQFIRLRIERSTKHKTPAALSFTTSQLKFPLPTSHSYEQGRMLFVYTNHQQNAVPNDALLTVGSESSFLKFVCNPGVMMLPNMHHKSPRSIAD